MNTNAKTMKQPTGGKVIKKSPLGDTFRSGNTSTTRSK